MSAVRPAEGLLQATATLELIELLRRRASGDSQEQLIRDLSAITPISWARARNTINKLAEYGIISVVRTRCSLAVGLVEDVSALIAKHVAEEVVRRVAEDSWACMRLDPATGVITIDSMTLPPMRDGLSMWLLDFGIASRVAIQARFWEVAGPYRDTFLSGVRKANATRPRRAKSAERLAAELARQAEEGEAAELWVLQYERERLQNHPFQDQIRRVSVGDVSAGYDIASFAAQSSLEHDLFIEVKSHGVSKRFFWSKNEIATAKEFAEQYALYLVDRTRMHQSGYAPHVISGPSPSMFSQPGSGWTVEATSFEYVAATD